MYSSRMSSFFLSLFLLLSCSFSALHGDPVPLTIDQLALKSSSPDRSPPVSPQLAKCQTDYMAALVHRCTIRAPDGEARICFADEVALEDVHELVGQISEMCCLLRCQAKTLERLCCRNAQQARCRKANCLPIRGHEVLWSAGNSQPTDQADEPLESPAESGGDEWTMTD